MTKTIFFEWQDFEEKISKNQNLQFPESSQFDSGKFELSKALGFPAISIFVDSRISNADLSQLAANGCKTITLRCAGFNMLDVEQAKKLGITVLRVASYSPESIAEFVFALILSLARNLNRERELHKLSDEKRTAELMGFLLQGKTIGIHGLGKIGKEVGRIAQNGFQMNVIFFDPFVNEAEIDGMRKVNSLQELYSQSDIVSIHVPLTNETKGSVNAKLLENIKPRFMLINTSRGAIINCDDIEKLLAQKKISYLGVDVWGDEDQFDEDLLQPNCIQTDHIAFFTEEAVSSILVQTLENISGNPKKENLL